MPRIAPHKLAARTALTAIANDPNASSSERLEAARLLLAAPKKPDKRNREHRNAYMREFMSRRRAENAGGLKRSAG